MYIVNPNMMMHILIWTFISVLCFIFRCFTVSELYMLVKAEEEDDDEKNNKT